MELILLLNLQVKAKVLLTNIKFDCHTLILHLNLVHLVLEDNGESGGVNMVAHNTTGLVPPAPPTFSQLCCESSWPPWPSITPRVSAVRWWSRSSVQHQPNMLATVPWSNSGDWALNLANVLATHKQSQASLSSPATAIVLLSCSALVLDRNSTYSAFLLPEGDVTLALWKDSEKIDQVTQF